MFSKSKSKANSAAKPAKPAVPSIISADLTVTGNLVSDGEIQIDGSVVGDIKTDALLIGEDANVQGEIVARRVRVHGHVDGQITAKSVTLAKTAHVAGDVIHGDLSIEKGAFLEGHCKRLDEAQTSDAAKRVKDVAPPVPAPSAKSGATIAKPSNGGGMDSTEPAKADRGPGKTDTRAVAQ